MSPAPNSPSPQSKNQAGQSGLQGRELKILTKCFSQGNNLHEMILDA